MRDVVECVLFAAMAVIAVCALACAAPPKKTEPWPMMPKPPPIMWQRCAEACATKGQHAIGLVFETPESVTPACGCGQEAI